VWRNRDDFSVWFQERFSVLRRSFSRYTPVGPFYMLAKIPVSRLSQPRLCAISRGCRAAVSMARCASDGRHDAFPAGLFPLKIFSCLDKPVALCDSHPDEPALIVHGGAWDILTKPWMLASPAATAQLGRAGPPHSGGSALDAIEAAIMVLEDDPVSRRATGRISLWMAASSVTPSS